MSGVIVSARRKINLGQKELDFILCSNSKSRNLQLAIRSGGRVVVTKPKRLSERVALDFLKSRADWIWKSLAKYQDQDPALHPGGSENDYLRHKGLARRLVTARIAHFNEHYGFSLGRIFIKNQKTRWGSCSHHGNLNFNYKLALLPPPLSDYIIVHELCHLQEFNHSGKFWQLVAQMIPDYLERRRSLKGKLS